MAWAGAIMNIASGVMGVAGNVADGQASAAQRAYGSQVARENARTVGDQSAAQEESLRRESRDTLAAQRAAIAESGTGFGGTNSLLMAQDAALAELDALNVRYEGRLKMQELDNQARMLGEERTGGLQRIFGKRGLGAMSHFNWAPGANAALFGKPHRGW